jgi:hypothetical protein
MMERERERVIDRSSEREREKGMKTNRRMWGRLR